MKKIIIILFFASVIYAQGNLHQPFDGAMSKTDTVPYTFETNKYIGQWKVNEADSTMKKVNRFFIWLVQKGYYNRIQAGWLYGMTYDSLNALADIKGNHNSTNHGMSWQPFAGYKNTNSSQTGQSGSLTTMNYLNTNLNLYDSHNIYTLDSASMWVFSLTDTNYGSTKVGFMGIYQNAPQCDISFELTGSYIYFDINNDHNTGSYAYCSRSGLPTNGMFTVVQNDSIRAYRNGVQFSHWGKGTSSVYPTGNIVVNGKGLWYINYVYDVAVNQWAFAMLGGKFTSDEVKEISDYINTWLKSNGTQGTY